MPTDRLPLVLARIHGQLATGVRIDRRNGLIETEMLDEPLEERVLDDVLTGAGFSAAGERLGTLPDTVGPGMRLLVCGLNPSVVAADAGYGFAGATNRFWKAAISADLTDRPDDPWWALIAHGVGMTDLVKRATPRSSEVAPSEYAAGAERVARLVARTQPAAVVFVGLEGWRAAIDRKAGPGWQSDDMGGRPAYVMPSTSGLNARVGLPELSAHLRAAVDGPTVRR